MFVIAYKILNDFEYFYNHFQSWLEYRFALSITRNDVLLYKNSVTMKQEKGRIFPSKNLWTETLWTHNMNLLDKNKLQINKHVPTMA